MPVTGASTKRAATRQSARIAHNKEAAASLKAMQDISQKFKLVEVDDETYLNASPELPKC